MATERIQIIVSSKGTVTVKREIEDIGTAAKKSNDGVDLLKRGLGLLAGVLSIGALVNFSDAGTRVANSLKVAGLEGENFANVQDRLYKTAIRNGQSAEALAAVYQKTSLVQKELGIQGSEVIGAVEGIAAAMKLSTAGTSAQAGALQQLSQLMGGSIVQAQEYNSLIDGAFPLVQAAAKGIDGMGGSVAKLTQAIKAGGFSSRVFFEGMMKGLQDTRELANSLPLTIGQSIVSLREAFTQWMNSAAAVNYTMVALAAVILFVANNIDLFVYALTPAVLLLTYLAGEAVVGALIAAWTSLSTLITTTLIPAVTALNTLLWANPYILIVAAVLAVAAALVYWRKELGITDKMLRTIWDTGVRAFNAIWEVMLAGWAIVEPMFTAWFGLWTDIYTVVETRVLPAIQTLWEYVKPALKAWLEGMRWIFDKWVELQSFLSGPFFAAAKAVFEGLIFWVQKVIDIVTTLINAFRKALALAAALGMGGDTGGGAGPTAPKPAGMREGGQFTVGGTGSGTDTTPVRFNANRGERVTVETRKQQRQNDAATAAPGETNVNVPLAITNVFDPAMIPTAIESTSRGQRSIINVIATNRDEINAILGVS